MNIHLPSKARFAGASRHRQKGMATVVVLALISIILIYVAANLRSLNRLEREIKLTNQHQVRRLEGMKASGPSASPSSTNAPAPAKPAPAESGR